MSDITHSTFIQPQNIDSKIWRYMNLAKFISMLDSGGLYFTQLEKLSKQEDPYEGLDLISLYNKRYLHNEDFLKQEAQAKGKSVDFIRKAYTHFFLGDIGSSILHRKKFYVNCWHMNQHESMAMWKVYGAKGHGIAVISTYRKVRDYLTEKTGIQMYGGLIKYTNNIFDYTHDRNIFAAAFIKNAAYTYENEVRFFRCEHDGQNYTPFINTTVGDGIIDFEAINNFVPKHGEGFIIKCDLNEVIDNIILAPRTEKWIYELIVSVMRKYGLEKGVEISDLLDVPYTLRECGYPT